MENVGKFVKYVPHINRNKNSYFSYSCSLIWVTTLNEVERMVEYLARILEIARMLGSSAGGILE